MATNFPTSIDSYTTKSDGTDCPQVADINNPQDAIVAIQTKIGINSSADINSLDYKLANIFNLIYPIGTIREFNVATNPATLLGFGTWSDFGTGRMTVAIDASQVEFDTNGETGGAKTKNLSHAHQVTVNGSYRRGTGDPVCAQPETLTSTSGGSATQDVMNPYIVVYRWVRTA
jgi:hypothetical protein